MTESAGERTVHWYYSGGGKEHGPILISRLRQMARRNEIKPEDFVRKGKTGLWVAAGTVVELTDFGSGISQTTTALEEPLPAPQEPSQLEYLQQSASGWLRLSLRSVIAQIEQLRTIVGYAALVVIVVSLAHVAIENTGFTWSTPVEPLAQYESLWGELQSHRESRVDQAVWDEFTERGRRELEPVVARLAREAGARNREAQLLLWAGRDCLPKMFSDSRVAPCSAEQQFAEYVKNVKRLRDGQPVYGRVSGRVLPPEPSWWDWFGSTPTTAFIAVVLTTANIGFVVWLVTAAMKRRMQQSASVEKHREVHGVGDL